MLSVDCVACVGVYGGVSCKFPTRYAHVMSTLTELQIRAAKPAEKAYKLHHERGLFMLVTPAGGRLWRFKYRHGGVEKLLTLGAYPDVSPKRAREKRDDARRKTLRTALILASSAAPNATPKPTPSRPSPTNGC